MRLLYLDSEGIKSLLDIMEKEISDIKSQSLKLVWHMRGGLTYNDVLNMSLTERQLITKLITDNMETTKKSGLPFF